MKILLLGTHLDIGGIPRYLLDLAGELTEKGHRVTVATSGGKWENALRERKIEHLFLDIRTKSELSPKVWKSTRTLKSFLSKNRFDLLHAHTRVTQVLAALVSGSCKIPYVTTCHGFYKRRLGRYLFPCWGEKVIAISEMVRQHLLVEFGLKEGKVTLVPNGVDTDRFHPVWKEEKMSFRRALGLPAEKKIVGSISRLVEVKGHESLLECVPSLRKDYPELLLVLVGDGPFRSLLEKRARELGISNQVLFVGEVEDPLPYLSSFDIFVHPSQWNEGFGLAVAEAMACGLPVIASKNQKGGLRMFVSHKENGFLLEGNHPAKLQSAIDELLRDSEFRETIGQNGRKTIEEKFSVKRMTESILRVYEGVIR